MLIDYSRDKDDIMQMMQGFEARAAEWHFLYLAAWVIPFALFWPTRSSCDFFGQWNNVLLWSAVVLALVVVHSRSRSILSTFRTNGGCTEEI